jgi:hypothetical protein
LKSDEWIAWSNKLREILEKKVEILHNASQQNEVLKKYRERIIEKEINVACGECFLSRNFQEKTFPFAPLQQNFRLIKY